MTSLYEFTLKLTASETRLSNISQKLSRVKAITVKECSYTSVTDTEETLMIKISGFSDHPFISPTGGNQYTKLLFLPPVANSTITYYNPNPEAYDVIHDQASDMYNFAVTVLINNEYSSNISSSNPVFIKLLFHTTEE